MFQPKSTYGRYLVELTTQARPLASGKGDPYKLSRPFITTDRLTEPAEHPEFRNRLWHLSCTQAADCRAPLLACFNEGYRTFYWTEELNGPCLFYEHNAIPSAQEDDVDTQIICFDGRLWPTTRKYDTLGKTRGAGPYPRRVGTNDELKPAGATHYTIGWQTLTTTLTGDLCMRYFNMPAIGTHLMGHLPPATRGIAGEPFNSRNGYVSAIWGWAAVRGEGRAGLSRMDMYSVTGDVRYLRRTAMRVKHMIAGNPDGGRYYGDYPSFGTGYITDVNGRDPDMGTPNDWQTGAIGSIWDPNTGQRDPDTGNATFSGDVMVNSGLIEIQETVSDGIVDLRLRRNTAPNLSTIADIEFLNSFSEGTDDRSVIIRGFNSGGSPDNRGGGLRIITRNGDSDQFTTSMEITHLGDATFSGDVEITRSTTGIIKLGVINSNSQGDSRLRLGTPNSDSHGEIVAYGSTHPVNPNQVIMRSRYGDLIFQVGSGGAEQERLRIETSGNATFTGQQILIDELVR